MLNINDNKDSNGLIGLQWVILGSTPWIADDIEDKIDSAIGSTPIHSLTIPIIEETKSWVFNQFIDLLVCQDIADQGL